jgi:alanyl-tRNA synthetase
VHQRLSENEGFKSKSFLELNPVTLQKFELKAGPTQDSMKYSWNSTHGTGDLLKSQIQIIWNGESCQKVVDADQTHILAVVLDKTQFYAEGGGQVSDTGFLASEDGTVVFNVTDVRKIGKLIFHIGYSTAPFKVRV